MSVIQEDIEHVIWLQTGFLGDIILQTAAISLLKKERPAIKQTLITTPLGVAALKGHKDIHLLCSFAKRESLIGSFRNVKKHLKESGIGKKNAVFLKPHLSARSSLLARYLGFKTKTFMESQLSFLSQKRSQRVALLHEAQRISLLLEGMPLNIPRVKIQKARPTLPKRALPSQWASLFNGEKKNIALAPGSVWGTKKWPKENYGILARKLLKKYPDYRIILLGSKEEMPCCDSIMASCQKEDNQKNLLNLAGKTSLTDLNGIYPNLSLLVANDSSPIHYASAFNIPTIAIFGATVPAMGFAPLAEGSRTIQLENLACRPCSDHGPKVCPLTHFKCMKELPTDLVFSACQNVLS